MSLRRVCTIMGNLLLIVHKFPVQPGAQVHVNDPFVFTQVAPLLQPPLLVAHSLTSQKIKY